MPDEQIWPTLSVEMVCWLWASRVRASCKQHVLMLFSTMPGKAFLVVSAAVCRSSSVMAANSPVVLRQGKTSLRDA